MKLFIKVINPVLRGLYTERAQQRNAAEDVGFDCFSPNILVPANARGFTIPLGIQAAPGEPRGYMLVGRSSITKTPLRLSNSVGIIDPGYRGEIQARVDNLSDAEYSVCIATSLFQLVAGDLSLLDVEFAETLSVTRRGTGGFGSTGNTTSDYTG